jgi:hypothetical protein
MRRTVATARHPTSLLVAAIVNVIRAKAAYLRKREQLSYILKTRILLP